MKPSSTLREFCHNALFAASINNRFSPDDYLSLSFVMDGAVYHVRISVDGIDIPQAAHLLETQH